MINVLWLLHCRYLQAIPKTIFAVDERNHMKVCFIQHEPYVSLGYFRTWIQEHHYDLQLIDCHDEKPTPQLAEKADMLVVLGGPQSPHTSVSECPYFDASAERATIQAFINHQRVVVGVCLGAQLIGETLGIPYEHSPQKEYGAVQVNLTPAGKHDPILKNFKDGAFLGEWHNNMMGINKHTPVLATSKGCPRQIVRYGSLVYGLQCHMELTAKDYEILIKRMGDILKYHRQYPYVQSVEEIQQIDCRPMNQNLAVILDQLVEQYQHKS